MHQHVYIGTTTHVSFLHSIMIFYEQNIPGYLSFDKQQNFHVGRYKKMYT